MTGQPDGKPTKVGIAINDIAAGATAIYSILAAELNRRQTGNGQYMDISLLDAGLAWTVWESGAYFGSGEQPAQIGTRHRRSTLHQAYRTADGYVTIGANTERLWLRLINDVLKRPDWADDARFIDLDARMAHIDELEIEIEAITTTLPTNDWVDRLDVAGVPGGPVLTYGKRHCRIRTSAPAGWSSIWSTRSSAPCRPSPRRPGSPNSSSMCAHRPPGSASTPHRCSPNSVSRTTRSTASSAKESCSTPTQSSRKDTNERPHPRRIRRRGRPGHSDRHPQQTRHPQRHHPGMYRQLPEVFGELDADPR